jgi:hypothetical protein
MIDFGPAGLALIAFISAVSSLVGVYGVTGFARRNPSDEPGR